MKEIAMKFMQSNKIISIYSNSDETDCFVVGLLGSFNDDDTLIYHISPHGLYDGYIVKKTENIYRIEQNGQYERKISELYSLRNQKHNHINIVNNRIMFSLLEYARLNELVITIELFESGFSDIQGIILENNDTICIDQYDDYGQENGQTYVNLNDISELRCDTDDEIKRQKQPTTIIKTVSYHTQPMPRGRRQVTV